MLYGLQRDLAYQSLNSFCRPWCTSNLFLNSSLLILLTGLQSFNLFFRILVYSISFSNHFSLFDCGYTMADLAVASFLFPLDVFWVLFPSNLSILLTMKSGYSSSLGVSAPAKEKKKKTFWNLFNNLTWYSQIKISETYFYNLTIAKVCTIYHFTKK